MKMNANKQLDRIYLSPSNASAFGGLNELYNEAKEKGLKLSRQQVKEYLRSKVSYTKHAPVVAHHKRNPIWAYCINYEWMGDLHDLSSLQYQNNR